MTSKVRAINANSDLPNFKEAYEALAAAETMIALVPSAMGADPVLRQLDAALELIVSPGLSLIINALS